MQTSAINQQVLYDKKNGCFDNHDLIIIKPGSFIMKDIEGRIYESKNISSMSF